MKRDKYKNKKLKEIITSYIESGNLKKGLDNIRVEKAWMKSMGKGVQNYTTHTMLKNKTLYVSLSSSVLRQELSYGKDKIIDLVNKELGKKIIDKLILK